MRKGYGVDPPSIYIYHCLEAAEDLAICEILWGIEEEGIPYSVVRKESTEALQLAYEGAQSSPLGVGIGIDDKKTVILHYNKLKMNQPLFEKNLNKDRQQMRALGSNAARLVKGVPFMGVGGCDSWQGQL